jgi:hypothetical protein
VFEYRLDKTDAAKSEQGSKEQARPEITSAAIKPYRQS